MPIEGRQAYLESEILHADPIRLVQLLYRGALQAVAKARLHIQARDIAARNRQITKASEILNELALSIDRERGGEIARNLSDLYDYMQRLLQDANFRQIEEPLVELEKLLGTLLEAWERCDPPAAEARTEPAAATVSSGPVPMADEGSLFYSRRQPAASYS